ncbi:MAG TPA: DinB family protein [Thermoanaerobaculia bacterium]|nr:DinB family protein [Thermoanaerobaculia bacterium]
MEPRPEQQRALHYLRRKGTEAPVARLREQVAETFATIEALLDEVPPGLRATRPGPGRWSAHEIVDHLVESHRPAVEQLGALVAGERPAGGPVRASLQSADPLARRWEDLVAALRQVHSGYRALLERATDATSLAVTAPVVMVVQVAGDDGALAPVTWERELDWKAFAQAFRVHTVQHRQQILATLAALGHPPATT